MASVIEKDNERHPSHPAYKQAHADVAAAEKVVTEEKTVKVPERKKEKSENN